MYVEYEDGVHEDAAKGGAEDEEAAAVGVGPRAGKERVDHGGDGLQDAVVPLCKYKINPTYFSILDSGTKRFRLRVGRFRIFWNRILNHFKTQKSRNRSRFRL